MVPVFRNSATRVLIAAVIFAVVELGTLPVVAAEITFNRDIRPILSDRCFLCHGPDDDDRQADLRLDVAEEAYKPLEYGTGSHVIKPGDPGQSELYLRVVSDDPDLRMPPVDSKLTLTALEKELLRLWIEQGAVYEGHWSWIAPQKAAPPHLPEDRWSRNEIDRFILSRLKQSGLEPNPPATPEKLLRRLSFDLTGLPPTLEELDQFLADPSDAAYEAAVERLLASSAFGERMAADWLDVARYSDTYGYQVDRDRFVWPWRDWVVRAFNHNLPYDEFITQQLAGDLLPNATDEQILATTFNRLHPQKVEGGSVPEEFRIEYIADRTQTFGTAFLGLTLECCRCHDHKFDPIAQKEYYQLTAFFDNIDEAGLYSYFTPAIPTPTLLLADADEKQKIAQLRATIAAEETHLEQIRASSMERFLAWNSERSAEPVTVSGEVAHLDFESVEGNNQAVPGVQGNAARLTGDDAINTQVGNFQRSQPFSVSLWINTPDVKERAVIFHRSRAWTDAGSRGYQLLIEQGKLSASLIHFWPGNAMRVRTQQSISTNQWHHVVMTYDGSSRAAGLRLSLDGELAAVDVVRDKLTKQITGGGGDNISIGERFRDKGFKNGLVDEMRVYDRELTTLEIAQLAAVNDPTARTPMEDEQLLEYYLSNVDEDYRKQLAKLQTVRQQLNSFVDGIEEIMVMQELEDRKPSYFLTRGEYDKRAEPVSPGVPQSLPPLPDVERVDRLALAQWLTSDKHPLTSRVAVNRIWQMFFVDGLVRTPEDFGSQGALPTHPELLDWLAVEFIENGWNLKQLIRQIVRSSAYRQSTQATPDQLRADPENRLLARMSSARLPAEMLRDNALFVSDLLVRKTGGPPAKPYEVEVAFKPTPRETGEGLYRRSLYTYWKRTGPAPVMMTLDAAKRDVCQVRREQTSSPLQAFVMLNGPQFVEAARQVAARVIQDSPEDDLQSLQSLFRLLTSRRPNERELAILRELLESQLQTFRADEQLARNYLSVGDAPVDESIAVTKLAAMASVANALFNYDECVIRR